MNTSNHDHRYTMVFRLCDIYHTAKRSEIGDPLGGLEPRLLAIVLTKLKRDLLSRQGRGWLICGRHNYFWKERMGDFGRVAEEVYAQQKTSGAAVQYIANYLWRGLDRRDRAIQILRIAHQQNILDESGQSQLIVFLHAETRHNESIPILRPLVELRPENIEYRLWLMHAYFRGDRQQDLLALLKATDEYLRKDHRWQEDIIATLGNSCLQHELFEQAVTYYEEAIHLHQRTQSRRSVDNGTLSSHYENLSRAYSGLKRQPRRSTLRVQRLLAGAATRPANWCPSRLGASARQRG